MLRGGRGATDRHRCVWGALPVFRPHWVCPSQGCLCFPVYSAQAPGCSIWSGPCAECGSSFRVLDKSADSVAPAFCAFPGLSGSGSQRFGCPFAGCGAPFPSVASGSGSHGFGCPLPGRCAPFSSVASGPGSQKRGCPLPKCGAPFPSAAPARAAGRVSGILQAGPGACLPGGRGWLLWG